MEINIKSIHRLFLAAILSVLAFNNIAFAQSEEHTSQAQEAVEHLAHEKFDAGKLITEHISDSHGWHLWGEGHEAVSIPLPVILYTDKGLEFFSSSAFHHGFETVHGHYNYRIVENKVVAVKDANEIDKEASAKIYDFSITKNVASLWVSIFILLVVFLSIAGAYKKNPSGTPKGIQSFVEPIIMFIRDDVAKPAIGHKYEKFMPFLLTIFFFILLNNLLGLIPIAPGGANLTGNIGITAVLAAFTFIYVTISGNSHYWQHIFIMPGVPKPVLLILTPIEVLGVFLRPFVLMIRLFANITAGHIIALSFFSLIFIFGEMSATAGHGVGVFSVLFTVFMGLLELLVAFIQAYVFTLLSAMYLGSAVEEPHHH